MMHLSAYVVLLFVGATHATAAPPDSAAVAATVKRFHHALEQGDTATVLALLAPDAVILESGASETRNSYREHHLPADMVFLRSTRSAPGPLRVVTNGGAAWVTSVSTVDGTAAGKPVALLSAELVVLSRTEAGWVIRAIHWSSRNRPLGK
jgi:ketosteroid isomerase-like protein